MFRLLLLSAMLCLSLPTNAAPVTVGDKTWRQVTDTVGFSWNAVASVCNGANGECNGTLGSVDFTGWTWASIADVRVLLEALIYPDSQQFPSNTSGFSEIYSAPGIASVFAPGRFASTQPSGSNGFFAWTQSIATEGFSVGNPLSPLLSVNTSGFNHALLGYSIHYDRDYSASNLGALLYQTAPVPLPAAAWLLLSGVGGLAALRRRRRA